MGKHDLATPSASSLLRGIRFCSLKIVLVDLVVLSNTLQNFLFCHDSFSSPLSTRAERRETQGRVLCLYPSGMYT